MKICTGKYCKGKKLPLERFNKHNSNATKYRDVCKMCFAHKNNKSFIPGTCEYCGKEHECLYGTGRFCNRYCAHKTNNNIINNLSGTKICLEKNCKLKGVKQPITNFYIRRNENGTLTTRNKCKICSVKSTRQYKSTLSGFIGSVINSCKGRSLHKGIEIDIEKSDISDLYKQQDGRCAISGMALTHKMLEEKDTSKYPFNLSLDRIDSSKGYTRDNIQLVCNWIQTAKSDWKQKDFIEWMKICVKYQSDTSLYTENMPKIVEKTKEVPNKVGERISIVDKHSEEVPGKVYERLSIIEKHLKEGKTRKDISKIIGLSTRTISKICQKHKLSNLNAHKSNKINISEEELYHYVVIEKLPFTTIAKIAKCSDNGIRKLCKKWCIEY